MSEDLPGCWIDGFAPLGLPLKKGIILASDLVTRLVQLTKIANKHLLPVYDKLMISCPLPHINYTHQESEGGIADALRTLSLDFSDKRPFIFVLLLSTQQIPAVRKRTKADTIGIYT